PGRALHAQHHVHPAGSGQRRPHARGGGSLLRAARQDAGVFRERRGPSRRERARRMGLRRSTGRRHPRFSERRPRARVHAGDAGARDPRPDAVCRQGPAVPSRRAPQGARSLKTLGIVGGIAPESTVEYYRVIIESWRAARTDGSYPHVVIDRINLQRLIELVTGARLGELVTYLAEALDRLAAAGGITLMVPSAEEREYIHGRYMDELIHGRFLSQTREAMAAIVDRLVERDAVQAVVLGGTELPLLFRDGPPPRVPLLDTMRIHAE